MKLFNWIAAISAAFMLSACSPPPAGVHETLTISDQGEFSFKGVPVPKEQLPSVLAAEKQRVSTLFAEIVVSPRANAESIKYAVESLKAAQIRCAFIDERVMKPARPRVNEGSAADR